MRMTLTWAAETQATFSHISSSPRFTEQGSWTPRLCMRQSTRGDLQADGKRKDGRKRKAWKKLLGRKVAGSTGPATLPGAGRQGLPSHVALKTPRPQERDSPRPSAIVSASQTYPCAIPLSCRVALWCGALVISTRITRSLRRGREKLSGIWIWSFLRRDGRPSTPFL